VVLCDDINLANVSLYQCSNDRCKCEKDDFLLFSRATPFRVVPMGYVSTIRIHGRCRYIVIHDSSIFFLRVKIVQRYPTKHDYYIGSWYGVYPADGIFWTCAPKPKHKPLDPRRNFARQPGLWFSPSTTTKNTNMVLIYSSLLFVWWRPSNVFIQVRAAGTIKWNRKL